MHPYLIPGLGYGRDSIISLVRLLSPERLDEPTSQDRFTPREILAHLADWEKILLDRMVRSLESPGTILQGIDEGELAIQNRYSETEIDEQAALFESRRNSTIEFLSDLQPEQWEAYGEHSERGRLSLYDQANLLLGHDLYHIEQLTAALIREPHPSLR